MADVTILPGDGQYDGSWEKLCEGGGGSVVTSHPHQVKPDSRGECWRRCIVCGLAEAAHAESATPYIPQALTFRCPDCVTAGRDPCTCLRERRPFPVGQ